MASKRHFLYSSLFTPSCSGHGGHRRTAQIHELLYQVDATLSPLAEHLHFRSASVKIFDYLAALPTSARAVGLPSRTSLFDWSFIQAIDYAIKRLSSNSSKINGLIWENTKDFRIPFATAGKLPLIALPQNIESLVKFYPVDNLTKYVSVTSILGSELKHLAKANLVISISEYDSWLMSSFGIESSYLPYWPCDDIETNCLQIRDARSHYLEGDDFILMIGSAVNPPTAHGILQFLRALPHYHQLLDREIIVVGYSVDTLTSKMSLPSNVRILGSIDNTRLNELLSKCKCVLIHQEYGTGSLTKIPELLLSGVPIVASRVASRNYSLHDGIVIYNEIADLCDILDSKLSQPRKPLRKRQEELRILDKLLNL